MLRRWLPAGGVLAAAAAVLLLLPETSSAQWFGRRGIGVNVGRFGFYYGSGSPYYSGFYPGYASGYYGWNYPYYGSTWYPRYYGSYRTYAPGFTRWYGPRYSYSYDWSTPRYYSYGYPSRSMGAFSSVDLSNQGYYGAQTGEMGPSDRTVLIDVRVPPEAEIWFEDNKTQSTGMFREFVSPALEPGQDYTYQMRARWMEGGQEVNKTRELRVRAGDQLSIDFLGESAFAFPSDQPGRGPAIDRNLDRMPKYGTEQTSPDTSTTPQTPPSDTGTSTPKTTPPENNLR